MENTDLIQRIRQHALQWLAPRVQTVLADSAAELSQGESDAPLNTELSESGEAICGRFQKYFGYEFDRLDGALNRKIEPGDYPDPSLVNEGFLEAVNAIEGMINFARNSSIKALINFNTRLDELFRDLTIDDTNSPLDPDRIARAFVDALAPIRVTGESRLLIYRHFNRIVLREINELLEDLNRLCIGFGVLPELVVDGRPQDYQLKKRSSARHSTSPLERAFPNTEGAGEEVSVGSSAYLFGTVVALLRGTGWRGPAGRSASPWLAPASEVAVPAAALTSRQFNGSLVTELGCLPLCAGRDMQIAGREVILITTDRLTGLLDQVQSQLVAELSESGRLKVDHRRFTRLLGNALLESSVAGTLNAITGEQFDRLLVISLLYESFCKDLALVEPVKELIVATQVVLMKIAIDEPDLFTAVNHPARQLLNEVAGAGVGGVDGVDLYEDPVYVKFESLLIRLIMEYSGDSSLLSEICEELRSFRTANQPQPGEYDDSSGPLESEREQRVAEINAYVSSRIAERISAPLHPTVDTLVNEHYYRFLLQVAQRDGPGSNSWILVMKILDLLLWTVKPDKNPGDRQRFDRLNGLLIPNLRKALVHSGLDEVTSDSLLAELLRIQKATFTAGHVSGSGRGNPVPGVGKKESGPATMACEVSEAGGMNALPGSVECSVSATDPGSGHAVAAEATVVEFPQVAAQRQSSTAHRQPDRHFLEQVDKLPIGCWLRFQMQGENAISCTLAVRLQDRSTLVFVNRQGVKVVEKSRIGLARELQQGSVRIISDWPLFERGLESVIARLRDRQQSD